MVLLSICWSESDKSHKCVLIIPQRSGGTWISDMLSTHVQINMASPAELLSFEPNETMINVAFDKFMEDSACVNSHSCMFRLPYNGFHNWQNSWKLTKRSDVSFVHVRRRNKINHWFSLFSTSELIHSGVDKGKAYHCHKGQICSMGSANFTAHPKQAVLEARRLLEEDENMAAILKGTGRRTLTVYYEDLMNSGFGSILDFLHVNTSVPLGSGVAVAKRVSQPLESYISNYAEFVSEVMKDPVIRWDLDYCFDSMTMRNPPYGVC